MALNFSSVKLILPFKYSLNTSTIVSKYKNDIYSRILFFIELDLQPTDLKAV